jgi:hypothetical protein
MPATNKSDLALGTIKNRQWFAFLGMGRAMRVWKGIKKASGRLTASNQYLVGAVLISQLGSVTLARFLEAVSAGRRREDWKVWTNKFNGNLLVVEKVGALEDDAKGAFTNLLANTIVDANDIGRRRRHGYQTERLAVDSRTKCCCDLGRDFN